MKKLIQYISGILTKKKSNSNLDNPSHEKKLIEEAIKKSNKMQKELLEEYKRKYPHKRQQFYVQ